MKKSTLILLLPAFLSAFLVVSCKKCYDCTKKCGACTHAFYPTVAGCEGDPDLDGRSIEAWKIWLESQNFTCNYNNATEEACGKSDKENKEDSHFDCVPQ